MKAVKAVLTTVTVWHVAGRVNLAKSNVTGKFVKNAIGQAELDNVIVATGFAKVDASVNWFGVVGGLFLAVAIAFLATLFGFAVAESHGSMFFLGVVTFAVLAIAPLILMDANILTCDIS